MNSQLPGPDKGYSMPMRLGIISGLVAAGLAGNYLAYDIFFNIQFIFGSICSLLILQLLGLRWGLLSSLLISSVTWHIWNHPYAIVIMTTEVLAVGLLVNARRTGLVLADALYWLFLGMPLVVLFYHGVMHLPLYAAVVTMLKQATNGIANALAARLLFVSLSPRWKREVLPMREVIFNLLVLFSLLPALFLTGLASRNELSDIDVSVRQALMLSSQRAERELNGWLDQHVRRVENTAWMAARVPVPLMQKSIEHTLQGDPYFLRMGLLDRAATVIAYSPLVDELGRKNIGRNFKDRPYIPVLRKTLQPMLSEVVMGRVGTPKPIVTALGPVVVRGRYAGYVAGILDLEKLSATISFVTEGALLRGLEYVLLDRNGAVIVSSRKTLNTMQPYIREQGDVTTQDGKLFQWLPPNAKNISVSDRWKKALYFTETPIGGVSGWKLFLEQPLVPFQKLLYERYSTQLAWIFGILLAALVTGELISRKITSVLEVLGAHSSDLPARLVRGEAITLPESDIRETQQLIRNIEQMAGELSRKFSEVNALNASLEERISERTRELRKSEEMYRMLAENTSDVFWQLDLCTNMFSYVSPAVQRLRGFTVEEVMTQPVEASLTPASYKQVQEWIAQAVSEIAAGKSDLTFPPKEVEQPRKDGSTVWTEVTTTYVLNNAGQPIMVNGISRDITERKRAVEVLRESEERFRSLFQNVQVAALVIDPDSGAIIDANATAAVYYGWPREELLGKKIADINTLPPDEVRKEITAAANQQRDHFVFRHRMADDTVRDVEVFSGPIPIGGRTVLYSIIHDITDRKLAEQRLSDAMNYIQTLVETSPIGIVTYRATGEAVSANAAAARIVGATHEQLMSQNFRTLGSWKRSGLLDAADIALTTNQEQGVELLHTTTFGKRINLAGRLVPFSFGGQPHLLLISEDVTERKQAEAALRRSQERLSRAQQVAKIGNWEWDVATNELIWSDEVYRIYGLDPAQDRPSYDTVIRTLVPEHRESFEKAIQEALERGAHFEGEYRIIRADGSFRYTHTVGEVARNEDGRPLSMFGVVQDITDRRLAEERFRQLANEQRLILETIGMGIVFAKDRKIIWANPAFDRIYGFAPGEFIGRDTRQVYADDADYARVGTEGYAMIATGQTYVAELRALRKDRTPIWISLTGRAVNPKVPRDGSIWLFQDITERKSAEKQLQEKTRQLEDLTRNLEQRVQEEIALRMRNEQILVQQSKLAAMGEMLGAIAHQWRQPLNALGLTIQNLRDSYAYGGLDAGYLERTVQKSMAHVEHMSKTIDDFRNFFQPDKEKTVFDAMQAVADVLDLFSAQLEANDITCRLACHTHGTVFDLHAPVTPCPEKKVEGYRNEFEHVILNLMNNSREAILDRRAAGSREGGRISFDFYSRDGGVVIRVSDNGGGIDPRIIDRIFEPYFTTKDPARGTGLGLYMVKVIVEKHLMGKLSVENDAEGAVFTIELAGGEAGTLCRS